MSRWIGMISMIFGTFQGLLYQTDPLTLFSSFMQIIHCGA